VSVAPNLLLGSSFLPVPTYSAIFAICCPAALRGRFCFFYVFIRAYIVLPTVPLSLLSLSGGRQLSPLWRPKVESRSPPVCPPPYSLLSGFAYTSFPAFPLLITSFYSVFAFLTPPRLLLFLVLPPHCGKQWVWVRRFYFPAELARLPPLSNFFPPSPASPSLHVRECPPPFSTEAETVDPNGLAHCRGGSRFITGLISSLK